MRARPVLHLYVVLVCAAAAAAVAATAILDGGLERWWLGVAVAALLAASHFAETRVRQAPHQRESFSHEETYIVVLALLASPLVTVGAFALGFAAGNVLVRREPIKGAFNTAAMVVQAAVAVAVVEAIRGSEVLGPRAALAAVAGAAAFFVANRLLIAQVLALAGARTTRANIVDDLRSRITVGSADAAIGILAAFGALAELWTLPIAAVAVIVLHSALSGHAQARAERQKFADLVDSTSDGIVAVGRDGRVEAWNPACERLTGYSAEDVVGLTLDDVSRLLAAQRKQGRDRSLLVFAAEGRELYDVRIARRDGEERWLAVSRAPTANRGSVIVLRDETPRREAEERRAQEESERLRVDLVTAVSHELRTPLTSMLGFTKTLLDRDVPDADRRRYLEIVAEQGKRLARLIDTLLDLRGVSTPSGPYEPVDVAELLAEQVEELTAAAVEHEIRLAVEATQATVLGDRLRIRQVVENLVGNAIKYSPGGSPIDVEVATHDEWIRVTVRDRGLGIPKEQQPHVFERFFRVTGHDRRAIGGTGLGLALARDIVRAHGGSIGFESTEGAGSTFWFELPLMRRLARLPQ